LVKDEVNVTGIRFHLALFHRVTACLATGSTMKAIPHITTSSARIVVDELRFRRSLLFGLVGRPVWHVHWRRTDQSRQRSTSFLRPGQTAGCAELAGESFDFVVRWRRDRRRPITHHPLQPSREQAFVTPAAVMELAEYPARPSPAPGAADPRGR
jgi:hypothetical protein